MKHQSVYNRLRRIEGQVRGIEDMMANEKSDSEILIQLEAVHSSVASTISTLIESMMEKDDEGKIVLDEKRAASILRLIKKS